MKRQKKLLALAAAVAGMSLVQSAAVFGGTFTWSGADEIANPADPNSSNITDPNNWVGGVMPNITTTSLAQGALHFGNTSATTVTINVQTFIDQIIFDPGAPTYFFPIPLSNGNDIAFIGGPNKLVINNSSSVQHFDELNAAGATLETPGAGFLFQKDSGSYLYGNGSTGFINIWLAHDITLNSQQLQSGPRNIYGANGPATTLTDPAATMILNAPSGTGSSGSNFIAPMIIFSGNVLVTDSNALGRFDRAAATSAALSGYYTYIRGSFNGDHSFGSLELANNISSNEPIRMDGRSGDIADYDHLVNVSGNNTLAAVTTSTSTSATVPSWQNSGGGRYNIDSLSGTLVLNANFSVGDPTNKKVITYRGAGNITQMGNVLASGAPLAVRKQGSGTLTMNGTGNSWDGGTMVDGGKLVIGAGGGLGSSNSRIFVATGATVDLTATGGYSLPAGTVLSGAGSVLGNLTVGGQASISPGGTDGLDAVNAMVVTAGTGTINLGNLILSGGGTLSMDLSSPTGSNDQISVGGNLSASGTTSIGITPLNNGTFANGTYTLITYAGTLTGDQSNFALSGVAGGSTRQTFSIDTSVVHQVNLNVLGNAASLTWVGGLSSDWDLKQTVNWTGDSAATPDNRFFNADVVTLDDSGSNLQPINLSGTVSPGQVTFANSSGHPYQLTGGDLASTGMIIISGSGEVDFNNGGLSAAAMTISGSGPVNIANSGGTNIANLTINGSSTVTVTNPNFGAGSIAVGGTSTLAFSMSNPDTLTIPGAITTSGGGTVALNFSDDVALINFSISGSGKIAKNGGNLDSLAGNNGNFSGHVDVNSGELFLFNSGFGNGATVNVADGATLDLHGTNNPTTVVTITGNGVNGVGALIDDVNLGGGTISHINGLVLAGDASIATINASFMFIDGNGAFVHGNGHDLSITGNNEIDFGDNAGVNGVGDPNLHNIKVNAGGILYYGGNTDLSNGGGTINLTGGGRLGVNAGNSAEGKAIIVDGGGLETFRSSPTIAGNITMNGSLSITMFSRLANQRLNLTGQLTGNGALDVHGSDTLANGGTVALVNDNNNYTGGTTIGGGGGLDNTVATGDHITLSIGNGGTTGSLPGNVTVNALGTLAFNKNTTFNFANTVTGAGGIASNATGGVVSLTGNVSYTGTTVVNAGTLRSVSSIASSSGVIVNNTGTFEAPNTQTLAALTINTGGKARIAANGANKSVLTIAAPATGGALTITTTGTAGALDVNNNALVVAYTSNSPAAQVRGYLASGFNAGNWNGGGINSTAAHNDASFATALGYVEAGDVGIASVDGVSVPANAVVVKYTYYGDANLDGTVTTSDFQRFVDGLATGGSTWEQGDFTYDGKVDIGNDFDLFLVGYMSHGGALGDLAPIIAGDDQLSAAQKSALLAVVPEPSSVGLIGLATAGLAARRRRRKA